LLDNLSVVIPCYNESAIIADIIEKLMSINSKWEIIIINDGSTDNSLELISKYPIKLINNHYNTGNGASVKKGILAATREYVVLMDGDGQHDPGDIPKLLEYVNRYDMVVGARINKKALSRIRSLGNFLMIRLAEYLTKQRIGDLTSGFRVFKRSAALPFLPLFPARYSYPTTLTLCMIKSGMNIQYVYLDSIVRRKQGKSSLNPLMDGMRFINIMIRVIMLYSPQTIFLPVGILVLLVSIVLTVHKMIFFHRFTPNIGLFYLASLFTILFGLLAEQIANMRFELIEMTRDRYNQNKTDDL